MASDDDIPQTSPFRVLIFSKTAGFRHVLGRGDPSTFAGGAMGEDHPLMWCQEFDGGKSFYRALGHYDEAYEDEWVMGQILRAILWTACVDGTV